MIDYKTVLSTTSSKVTLLEYLHALSQEFGESKIDSITLSNSGNKTLTFTFVLADGTVKTTSATAITLTEDEKSLISELIKSVSASSEGVTFNQAVTFAGNVVLKGNEIHQGYESHLGDESHSGTATYKGIIKTSEIDNTAGNAMLRNKDTEGAIVLGSVSKKAVIMGSGDRPTYSKDGSDFTGSELALKSDVAFGDAATFFANMGVGRYAGQDFISWSWYSSIGAFADGYMSRWTNMSKYMCRMRFDHGNNPSVVTLMDDINAEYLQAFAAYCTGCSTKTLYLKNRSHSTDAFYACAEMFYSSEWNKILVSDGCVFKLNNQLLLAFSDCKYLTEIGAFDVSKASFPRTFGGSTNIELIHCKNWNSSFDLTDQSKLTESAVVEIFGNLMTTGTTKSVTLNASVFDLLSTADIAIATGKGWSVVRAS